MSFFLCAQFSPKFFDALQMLLLSAAQVFNLRLERGDLFCVLLGCGFRLRLERGEFCQPLSFTLGAQVGFDLGFQMSLFGGLESLTDLSNAYAEFSLGVVVILDLGIEVQRLLIQFGDFSNRAITSFLLGSQLYLKIRRAMLLLS